MDDQGKKGGNGGDVVPADEPQTTLQAIGAGAAAVLATTSSILTYSSPFLCVGAGMLALFLPAPFAATITSEWVEACLALLMLSMGLTLTLGDIIGAIRRPLLVLLSLSLEYIVAPLSAFTLGHIFRLSPPIRAGLTLMASVNGGQASNLCTYISRGDVGVSVLMTLSSSILATGAIPALSKIYLAGVVEVDAGGLAASTAKLVMAPLAAGLATKVVAGPVVDAVEPVLPMVGIIALVIIVLGTTSLASDLIRDAWRTALVPTALFHIIGFCIGYTVARFLARQKRPVATAVAFESGFKSPALSFVLARRHFADPIVQTSSAVSILVLVPMAMGAAVAFHLWYVCTAQQIGDEWGGGGTEIGEQVGGRVRGEGLGWSRRGGAREGGSHEDLASTAHIIGCLPLCIQPTDSPHGEPNAADVFYLLRHLFGAPFHRQWAPRPGRYAQRCAPACGRRRRRRRRALRRR